jgi:Ni,Fe-hydrogenase III component G
MKRKINLLNELGLAIQPAADGFTIDAATEELPEVCGKLFHQAGARLVDMVATDERREDRGFAVYYIFSLPPAFVRVQTHLDPAAPVYHSVTPVIPGANWYEREAKDLLGLIPQGHPDPHRLVLHRDWPTGIHPLRKEFPYDQWPERESEPHAYQEVEGEGVFVVPVGPIHAGIIEPGHFRFSTVGEFIVNFEARLL